MSAFLVAESGHKAALGNRAVRVGSDARAELRIQGNFGLAPLHYEIIPVTKGHWVRNLHPQFSIQVDGQDVETAFLKDGCIITAGALVLTYQNTLPQTDHGLPPVDPVSVARPSARHPAVVTQSLNQKVTQPFIPPQVEKAPRVETPPPTQEPPPAPVLPVSVPLTQPPLAAVTPFFALATAAEPQVAAAPRRDFLAEPPPPLPWAAEVPAVVPSRAFEAAGGPPPSETRTVRLMADAWQRTQMHVSRLKAEQNFGGAIIAALFALAAAVLAYSVVCQWRWDLFMFGIAAIGSFIGWVVMAVGRGMDVRFGYLACGTALAAILITNAMRCGGYFDQAESPAATSSASGPGTESAEKSTGSAAIDSFVARMMADPDMQALHPAEELRRIALEAARAAQDEAAVLGEVSPPDPLSVLEPEQSRETTFATLTLGPKSLLAFLMMSYLAYRASFRRLTPQEIAMMNSAYA